jgi:sulfite reductase (NADPH) flavoprotein alpha-component
MGEELYIIYGSRTGNSRSIAEMAGRYAEKAGLKVCLLEMKNMNFRIIEKIKYLLLVVSTHGEGDPPAVALDFYEYLYDEQRARLEGLSFAVLALGDSSYKDYCKTGKDFRARLLELGANEKIALQECDVDFEETASKWIEIVVPAFFKVIKGKVMELLASFSFDFYADAANMNGAFQAEVVEKRNLCSDNSTKKTLHIALSMGDRPKEYIPGDSVAVKCSNSRLFVDQLLGELKYDGTYSIRNNGSVELLKQVLIKDYELSLITPVVLKKYAEKCKDEKLNELVNDQQRMNEYCTQCDVLDMVKDFPSNLKPEELLSVLRKLKPRLYSVASSARAHEKEVHLTLGVMEYEVKERKRIGITSSYLSDRTEVGEKVSIYFEENDRFRLPTDDNVPIIMIGSGTGIAAYRSFLQERESSKAKGENWLIFGERSSKTDFLYKDELQKYLDTGVLNRMDTAFSRDQEQKIYVQDKLIEESAEIFDWIHRKSAIVYICGNKRTMAVGVRNALAEVIREQGNMNNGQVEEYIGKMKSEKRWQEDVY